MIIQNMWIAGGYSTSREIVDFIAKYGVLASVTIIVSTITLIIATYLTLEVAKVFNAFNYMTWSKQFLGKFLDNVRRYVHCHVLDCSNNCYCSIKLHDK
jgi:uncharacterized membrane protein YkvI